MAAKVFVIAGHGAGDPGACAGGHTEADLVRKLASRMKALGGSAVQVGDTGVNWYASNWISKGKCPKGVPVIELHMDSAAASAKGGHVIIRAGLAADSIDKACEKFIKGFFPGRSTTLSKRSDLANPNRAYNAGVNYRLVECGFISNASDRNKFISQMDDLARGLLSAFGVKAGSSSQTTTEKPSGGSTASQSGKSYTVRVTADELNIRKGPGTGYGVAGSIKDKGVYTIVQESDGKGSNAGWGKLKSGAGWISLDFCERTGGGSYVVTVTADTLNVRKGPGTGYGIATTVRKGEAYTIVDESSGKGSDKGWGKLKSGAGWISLDFVKKA